MATREDASGVGEPGDVRRFVQTGTWSIVACCVTLGVALVATAGAAVLVAILLFVTIGPAILMLSTLTVAVDDGGVEWYFSGKLFKKRLSYHQLATCEAQTITPLGLGYRMGPNRRAWIVSGRRAVVFADTVTSMRYIVGCSDPDAICAEIERRRQALA